MSWQATAYVKELKQCPDGAELSRGQKLLLFVLSDYHHTTQKLAWPSVSTLAEEALSSLAQVKRDLAYLEEHCVIRKMRPEKTGRTHSLSYQFLELDDPKEQTNRLNKRAHGEPLFESTTGSPVTPFCPEERGSKGAHGEQERGSKGAHGAQRNKEEPVNHKATGEHSTPDGVRTVLDGMNLSGGEMRRLVSDALHLCQRKTAKQQADAARYIVERWVEYDRAVVEYKSSKKTFLAESLFLPGLTWVRGNPREERRMAAASLGANGEAYKTLQCGCGKVYHESDGVDGYCSEKCRDEIAAVIERDRQRSAARATA